jgi:hypothetical protein
MEGTMGDAVNTSDRLTDSLNDVWELEQFLVAFISALTKRRLRTGQDVTHLVDELGLKLPATLTGAPVIWAGRAESADTSQSGQGKTLVLARPGQPDVLGFTVGCLTIHGRRYCLVCGWLYCRIVVKF